MRRWLMVLLVVCGVSPAFAAPFGISKGQPIASLKVLEANRAEGEYRIAVPFPNAEFESYWVVATREDGVCQIAGLGKSYTYDGSGERVRRAFADLRTKLTSKYQIGRLTDELMPGSIEVDAPYWMMSVMRGERKLLSVWDGSAGAVLPENLRYIELSVRSTELAQGYLRLIYQFDNIDVCKAHIADKQVDGL